MRFTQLYKVAEDFVDLNRTFKLAIGQDLNLTDSFLVDAPEEFIEYCIWLDVLDHSKLSEFIDLVEHYNGRSA